MNIDMRLGDCLDVLPTLEAGSVHCCVTSPPYWGLRDYGTATWEGGDEGCDHRKAPAGGWQGQVDRGEDKVGYAPPSRPPTEQYGNQCPKCGANRIDSQLGLEATPEDYVAKMVEVFRAVRRVLRDDGTLWLNMGDSYAQSGYGQGGGWAKPEADDRYDSQKGKRSTFRDPGYKHGLKSKDLVGMPWRVARALQEPYYTGTIRDVGDRIWLAAMIDAEGCIFIHKRKAGRDNGQGYKAKKDSYGSGLEVSNTSPSIPEMCLRITGKGSICTQESGKFGRKKTLYRWNIRSNECRGILKEVYPHLVAKQHEARLAMGCPVDGDKAIAAHTSLKGIHQGDDPSIDFPPPQSMFEPGWYLRSDIIWAKSNPMPESCTDRPTKSHEYLFLLTKSARYYYDAEAIREDVSGGAHPQGRGYGNPQERSVSGAFNPSYAAAIRNATAADMLSSRNKRSVWTIATQPYAKAHFATFPEALVLPCILAGTSEEGCCSGCGAPDVRVVDVEQEATTTGWEPTCTCDDTDTVPCTVLDPFLGSGTTAKVAHQYGRQLIGCELSPEYLELARDRFKQSRLFT